MTQIDQLLAKALSTTSEEEAIACLRMARKKGSTYTTSKHKPTYTISTYGGYTAKEWRDAAMQLREESEKLLTSFRKLKEDYSNLRTQQLNAVRALEDQKLVTKVVVVIYSVCLLSVVTAGYML